MSEAAIQGPLAAKKPGKKKMQRKVLSHWKSPLRPIPWRPSPISPKTTKTFRIARSFWRR